MDDEINYRLLKILNENPKISQRELAKEMGVSLGKVNYCIKALIQVGIIKIKNFARSDKKAGYLYTLTPKGLSEKTLITQRFLREKQAMYESLQREIKELKMEIENEP